MSRQADKLITPPTIWLITAVNLQIQFVTANKIKNFCATVKKLWIWNEHVAVVDAVVSTIADYLTATHKYVDVL